ncbi:MAG: adenine phosphoribosyltransferase [Sulfurospirillum sp.]|nr:adenine phosphoribosyltransferase [Sulfurospirillum sp.]MBL0703698.1 adenine phosphoribosyltransferase [Sulfurospirillum sp.]
MKTLNQSDKKYLLDLIRDVKDFPKPGIIFKDITTLLSNAKAYNFLIDHLAQRYNNLDIDFIAGIEARGFIFGAALASKIGKSFVPIRKPGKLPYTTISEKYSFEYGIDEVEMHIDAFKCKKDRPKVLLIDDLIATGGTATAAVNLINKVGAECIEACFVLNLTFLQGDKEIKKTTNVYSVLEID